MPTELTPLLLYCLETTSAQLADEFRGVCSPETVRRHVQASYEQVRSELYHHVWELIETLVPSVDLLDLPRPTGGKS